MPLPNARGNIDVGQSPSKTEMDSNRDGHASRGAIASNFDDEHGIIRKGSRATISSGIRCLVIRRS